MIVEFIGTPGAGKTTLLPTVIEYLESQQIRGYRIVEAARPFAGRTLPGKLAMQSVPSPWQRPVLWQLFLQLSLAHRLTFFAHHRQLMRQIMDSQRRRPIPPAERRHATRWFYHMIGNYSFLRSHLAADEALILDEGFVHRAVQFNASADEKPNPAQIRAYIDLIPRPNLVIAVHVPWEVCTERIYRRGLWARFQHKSRADVSAYVANSHHIVNLTVDYIRRLGWRVIELDNDHDEPAPARAELWARLHTLPALPTPSPCLEKEY